MARILLSAYACEPARGSEPAVGWGWATELARQGHEVTVVTRAVNRRSIERETSRSAIQLTFLYYDLPHLLQRMRRFPGGKGFYYVLWQWFAARMLRRRFSHPPFDVIQHVTYVSVRRPSFMGLLGIAFYFGPVSGGEVVPLALRSGFPARGRLREAARDISNRMLRWDPLMRRTLHQATRVFVTHDTLPLLPPYAREKATETLAIALGTALPDCAESGARTGQTRLLYAGRLLDWKAVDLALCSLRLARQASGDFTFTIVGDGPARPRLERLCRNLGLSNLVHWAGWVPHSDLREFYRNADVLLFPSLRDSGGMTVLEALAYGVPVVCTDLGGPGLLVNRSCGRVVATAGHTREQVAQSLAEALLELAADPHLRETLSHHARLRAAEFTFERLVRKVYPAGTATLMEASA